MDASYEQQTRNVLEAKVLYTFSNRSTATATAKREGLPIVQEWAKKPRKMAETVKFLMALEETCKEQERTGIYMAEDGLRKKVHDQAQQIRALHKMLKDVAAYIKHGAINRHRR